MHTLRPSSEAEVIASWLEQEYAHHARHGVFIEQAARAENVPLERIANPDVQDACANAERRRVLVRYRGYGTDLPVFLGGFPVTEVDWWWMALPPDELIDTRYIQHEPFITVGGGTRSPRTAAIRIRSGEIAAEIAAPFLALAERLERDLALPPVILASAGDGQGPVILEGHTRITAWALRPETIPDLVTALVGISPDISRWDEEQATVRQSPEYAEWAKQWS